MVAIILPTILISSVILSSCEKKDREDENSVGIGVGAEDSQEALPNTDIADLIIDIDGTIDSSDPVYSDIDHSNSNRSSARRAIEQRGSPPSPSSTTISISSGAAYTTSSSVTLGLSASGASEMYVSNTAGCGAGGSWETYATSKSWTLGQSNATATVYVKYRDTYGNESSCINDTIVHDGIDPTEPGSMDDSNESSLSSVSFSWSASTDSGSGIQSYEVSVGSTAGNDDIQSWTDVGNVTSNTVSGLSLTESNTYYGNVRAKDNAGRVSTVAQGNGFTAMDYRQVVAGGYHT